jgi:hypothetical protein
MTDHQNADDIPSADERRVQFSQPGGPPKAARTPEVVLPRGVYERGSYKDRRGNRGG